jgi:hypothetical protein
MAGHFAVIGSRFVECARGRWRPAGAAAGWALGLVLLAAAPATPAESSESPAPGVWACQSIASGAFTGRPCRLEPALTLTSDGRYRWGREEGEWRWDGTVLTLSGRTGSGQLDADGRLIFEYRRSGQTYRLTLFRRS